MAPEFCPDPGLNELKTIGYNTFKFLGVEYDDVNGTSTFTYEVCVQQGTGHHGLSHFVIGFCEAYEDALVPGQTGWSIVDDPTTGLFGIKLDLSPSQEPTACPTGAQTYSFTLDQQFALGAVDVATKNGQVDIARENQIICGPICALRTTGRGIKLR